MRHTCRKVLGTICKSYFKNGFSVVCATYLSYIHKYIHVIYSKHQKALCTGQNCKRGNLEKVEPATRGVDFAKIKPSSSWFPPKFLSRGRQGKRRHLVQVEPASKGVDFPLIEPSNSWFPSKFLSRGRQGKRRQLVKVEPASKGVDFPLIELSSSWFPPKIP